MNQEAEGTGVARQGAGGATQRRRRGAVSRESRSTGPQQVASNRAGGSLLGSAPTQGSPRPLSPWPAPPTSSMPSRRTRGCVAPSW